MAEVVRIEGLRELNQALKKLPLQVENRVLSRALRAGGQVVVDAAVNNALSKFQGEGFMADHIGQRPVKKSRLTGQTAARFIVGVLSDIGSGGLKRRAGPRRRDKRRTNSVDTGLTGFANSGAYYWRFLEFGTAKMPARPFLRPAFHNNKATILARITRTMAKGIEREARKLVKQRGAR